MIPKEKLIEWLRVIADTHVAIDDGGLQLVGVTPRANGTIGFSGSYNEIGGIPLNNNDD